MYTEERFAESAAEDVFEVFVERKNPDGLFGQACLIVSVELSPSLGLAEQDPVRGLVAGAAESWSFDEGFEQDGAVSVLTFPVVWESSCGHPEDAGGEVVAADPREDQNTLHTLRTSFESSTLNIGFLVRKCVSWDKGTARVAAGFVSGILVESHGSCNRGC